MPTFLIFKILLKKTLKFLFRKKNTVLTKTNWRRSPSAEQAKGLWVSTMYPRPSVPGPDVPRVRGQIKMSHNVRANVCQGETERELIDWERSSLGTFGPGNTVPLPGSASTGDATATCAANPLKPLVRIRMSIIMCCNQ